MTNSGENNQPRPALVRDAAKSVHDRCAPSWIPVGGSNPASVGQHFDAVRLPRGLAAPVITSLLLMTERRRPGPVVSRGESALPTMWVLLKPGAAADWGTYRGTSALEPGELLNLPALEWNNGPGLHWFPSPAGGPFAPFCDPLSLRRAVDHACIPERGRS